MAVNGGKLEAACVEAGRLVAPVCVGKRGGQPPRGPQARCAAATKAAGPNAPRLEAVFEGDLVADSVEASAVWDAGVGWWRVANRTEPVREGAEVADVFEEYPRAGARDLETLSNVVPMYHSSIAERLATEGAGF